MLLISYVEPMHGTKRKMVAVRNILKESDCSFVLDVMARHGIPLDLFVLLYTKSSVF